MAFLIRYRTASHVGWDGPYETLDAAREIFAAEWHYYRGLLATIVEADPDFPDDIRHAPVLEDADDIAAKP